MIAKDELPLDRFGEIVTSADFGTAFLVRVEYNTDEHGAPVADGEDGPSTLHGPFNSRTEAKRWCDAYPIDDPDVVDVSIETLNRVRPV